MAFSRQVLYYGREEDLPRPIMLRAGPLSLLYEDGTLRRIRLGEHEVLHQIYSAVRDQNWGTVPGALTDVHIDQQSDAFRISYRSEHRRGDVHFVWQAAITGAADGTIVFHMDGQALSTFKRNRIGFCVLHPMSCAGVPCTIEQVDGRTYESRFPEFISPHQPFKELRAITHTVIPGIQAEVRMEGDVFEMEDQRNWTDASFKTYCTPLELPFPVTVESGTRIVQTITLRLIGAPPALNEGERRLTFRFSEVRKPLPAIGLGMASHGQALDPRAIQRLQALRLSHLRADIRLSQPSWPDTLRRAAGEAAAIGAGLEIALHLAADSAPLAALRRLLAEPGLRIKRWLIFRDGEKTTSRETLELARRHLADRGEPLAAGTDAFFAELNRSRPPVDLADLITYSINPLVHAFDNASMVETLAAQAVTLQSARQFAGGHPIVVSPVTFKMRWNPNATASEPPPAPGELPSQVDERQMSLFGAGWTLGSLKYLAEGGAASVTYYETTGWRGVMETAEGSPLPDRFRSVPGGVYPMWHVFADVGEFSGGEALTSYSSDSLTVDGLVLRQAGRTRILLANFTPDEQALDLPDVSGSWRMRRLDETCALAAMTDPEGYRSDPGQSVQAAEDGLRLRLPPFSLLRLDNP